MKDKIKRISIDLPESVIKILRANAEEDSRVLKKHVEKILKDLSKKIESKQNVKA